MASRYWVGGTATWDATAGTKWAATSGGAGGQSVPGTADLAFFDANSGANTVTLGASTTISRLIMLAFPGTLAFGTNTISLNSNNTTVFFGDTTYSVSGTPVINLTYSGSTGTRFVNTTAVTEANAISFNITAGTDTLNFFSGANAVKNIDFTGFGGTISLLSGTIYGDLNVASGVTWTAGVSGITFAKASGTQTVTSNAVTLGTNFTVNSSGTTVTLADNTTLTNSLILTSGTFNIAGKTFTCTAFSSSGSTTRVLAFGVGSLNLTSTGTIWNTGTATNLSYTGTPTVNISNNSATATTVTTGALTEAQAMNFNYTVGTYTLTDSSSVYKNLSFTGFTGTVSNSARTIYGNLTVVTGATNSAGANATTFAATSGAQNITTNAVTLDYPITQNNSGATLQLQDNLTLGSTRTFTHTGGTLDLNTRTATINTFSSTGSGTRAINFNSGTLSIPGTTTSAFTASGSNLTTSGTGTITMTAATAKTFAGGGFTYTATLNQGGAGALTISGSNTFYDITATTLPSTITFTAGTTQTVTQFTASGTAGNLLTLNSSSPGTPFTLSDASGTVSVSYVSITDSTATGGATWNSLLTNGNVNGGGNTGWVFSLPVTYSYSSDIKLRSMTQRGRF